MLPPTEESALQIQDELRELNKQIINLQVQHLEKRKELRKLVADVAASRSTESEEFGVCLYCDTLVKRDLPFRRQLHCCDFMGRIPKVCFAPY